MIKEENLKIVEKIEKELKPVFEKVDKICLYNQEKVLSACRDANLCLADMASSTGYGNDDRAKVKLGQIYAKAFGAESAIVSPLISSGTHALTIALFGLLRPNDIMFSVTGKPYDTLLDVIFKDGVGSLKDFNVRYEDVELVNNNFDTELILKKLEELKPKILYIQRSRGYTDRESLSVEKIEKLVKSVRTAGFDTIIFVDNCYGEFVEMKEPCGVGADVMVGSLIKNAGGGIAPTGAYIAGKRELIELISSRHIAPGIGMEVGSYAGSYTPFFQGFFIAPQTVKNAIKGELLLGAVLDRFGIKSRPNVNELPHDIVRTIIFNDKQKLINFCEIIQSHSPVDSGFVPTPWEMPGYNDEVIMAAGTFIQGASIELSCDGPIREPYYCYLQGSLTYEHAKIVATHLVDIFGV